MIECIIGSVIGTLIGLLGSFFVVQYMFNKNIKKLKQLIEDMNTFKITLKNEVFRES